MCVQLYKYHSNGVIIVGFSSTITAQYAYVLRFCFLICPICNTLPEVDHLAMKKGSVKALFLSHLIRFID